MLLRRRRKKPLTPILFVWCAAMNRNFSAFLSVLSGITVITIALPAEAHGGGEARSEAPRSEASHGGGGGGGGGWGASGGGGGNRSMGGWGGGGGGGNRSMGGGGFFGSGAAANANRGMSNNMNPGASTGFGNRQSYAQVQANQLNQQNPFSQSQVNQNQINQLQAQQMQAQLQSQQAQQLQATQQAQAAQQLQATQQLQAAQQLQAQQNALVAANNAAAAGNAYPFGYNGFNGYGMAPNLNTVAPGTLMQWNNNLAAQQQYWMNMINSGTLNGQQLAYAQNMLAQLQSQQYSVDRTLNRDMNGNLNRGIAASAITAGLVGVVRGLGSMGRAPAQTSVNGAVVPQTSVTGAIATPTGN
jgi:hypothetical protein